MANYTIDGVTPRSNKTGVRKRMPVTTFIRDTFFANVETFPTKKIKEDFYKNGQVIAPVVIDNVKGVTLSRDGFVTREFEPPMVAPMRIITASEMEDRRGFNEGVVTNVTAEERAERLEVQDMEELNDAITRTEELMCCLLLQDGKLTLNGYADDIKTPKVITIDFGADNSEQITGTATWDLPTTAKPSTDISNAITELSKQGYRANWAIMNQYTFNNMYNTDDMKDKLDRTNDTINRLSPQVIEMMDGQGYSIMGFTKINGVDVALVVYNAFYQEVNGGTQKPYIKDGYVIIAPDTIMGSMNYAAITQVEKNENGKKFITYETTRAPKQLVSEDNDNVTNILRSKPLPTIPDLSSWKVILTEEGI